MFCLFVFFARPSSLLLPRSPRSALLSPPLPLPLQPRSSLPLLPFSPFVVALLGHALKLLVSTRACCYALGRAHTFILLLPFLPAFCSRASFLLSSRPLSHALCVAFAYLLSSPLLFVWGTHTGSYSYACNLPPFSSSILTFLSHSCRTPFMCVTTCRHRGALFWRQPSLGVLALCIHGMLCYLFFMSWTLCFLRRPRVSVSYCLLGGTRYLLVGVRTLCFSRRPRVSVFSYCIPVRLLLAFVLDSLFFATPKSKRVLMHAWRYLFLAPRFADSLLFFFRLPCVGVFAYCLHVSLVFACGVLAPTSQAIFLSFTPPCVHFVRCCRAQAA